MNRMDTLLRFMMESIRKLEVDNANLNKKVCFLSEELDRRSIDSREYESKLLDMLMASNGRSVDLSGSNGLNISNENSAVGVGDILAEFSDICKTDLNVLPRSTMEEGETFGIEKSLTTSGKRKKSGINICETGSGKSKMKLDNPWVDKASELGETLRDREASKLVGQVITKPFKENLHGSSLAGRALSSGNRGRLKATRGGRGRAFGWAGDGNKSTTVTCTDIGQRLKNVHHKRGVRHESSTVDSNPFVNCDLTKVSSTSGVDQHHKVGPFTITKGLFSEEYERILEYIYLEDSTLLHVPVVDTPFNYLTRHLLQSLCPGAWVTGEVINVMCEVLTLSLRTPLNITERADWYLSTRFADVKVDVGRLLSDRGPEISARQYFFGNLNACIRINIPVFLEEVHHWVYFVVLVQNRFIDVYNSCHGCGSVYISKYANLVLSRLDFLLKDDIKGCVPNDWAFTDFVIRVKDSIPQQKNSFDCGIYVIMSMAKKKIIEEDFNSEEERAVITMDLVMGAINSLKDKICHEASLVSYPKIC